jgi:hypothetical protein
MNSDGNGHETLSDRLAALDEKIARMKAFSATKGDVLALRLIETAEAERRTVLAQIPAGARKA